MNKSKRQTYINNILAFQGRMQLTNKKMAEILEISEKTYVRFISGYSIQHELDFSLRVSQLSGKTIQELTGLEVTQDEMNNQLYAMLDAEHRHYADIMLQTLYNDQMSK